MNTPAEKAIVGAIVSHPDSFEKVGLRADHFFDIRLRSIWATIERLRRSGNPIDEITIADAMGKDFDAAGGFAFLGELVAGSWQLGNILSYSEAIRSAYTTRKVQEAVGGLESDIAAGIGGEQLLEGVMGRLRTVQGNIDRDAPTYDEIIARQADFATETCPTPRGLETGLGLEKWVHGGVPRGMVTTLFSAPGNMKSTTKNALMLHWATLGYKTFDASFEDPNTLTASRVLSGLSGIPYGRIHVGALTTAERTTLATLAPNQWAHTKNIVDGSRCEHRIQAVCRQARKLKATSGLDAVCVDYIGLLGKNPDNQHVEFGIIMGEAKQCAMELDIAWLFIAQQKQTHKGRPVVTGMYGSDAMHQESKLILGIYHPAKHHSWANRHLSDNIYSQYPEDVYKRIVEVHILKNVVGESGKLVLLEADAPTGKMWPHHRSSF